MKTLRFIGMTMMMVMLAGLVSSCNKDDDDESRGPGNSIVGTWYYEDDSLYGEITFTSDYKITLTEKDRKTDKTETESGTYSLSGDRLIIKWQTGGISEMTYQINGNELILRQDDLTLIFKWNGRDNNSNSESGNSSTSSLTGSVWQLYKGMDDELGNPTFNEMEVVDYPSNGYSKGYRIRFNSDGSYTFWDWNAGKWKTEEGKSYYEPSPYTLNGNILTIYWDYEGLSGYTDKDDHTTGTISFSGNTMTWQGNIPFKFKYIFNKVGE